MGVIGGGFLFAFADDGEDVAFLGEDGSAVLVLDDHFAGEDFEADDFSLADLGDDHGTERGEFAAVFLVGVVFVPEAAFQAAAAAGDFGGIEGGLLEFGHLHGDGGHFAEVGVAADGFAAVAVIGEELGFVADADLAHFDAGVELLGEGFDEVAEVDSVFGEVVEDEAFLAEEVFGVDELHLEFVLGDELLAAEEFVAFLAVEVGFDDVVVGGGFAEDGSAFLLEAEVFPGLIGGGAEDFAPFDASFAADDDGGVAGEGGLPFGDEFPDGAGEAVADDVTIGHERELPDV